MNYQQFLESKRVKALSHGIDVDKSAINPLLFPFQRDIVRWALHKGRAAIFADTGLGKTFMQIEWARLISNNTLIIAPLNVSKQTIREGIKLGVTIRYVKQQSEVIEPGIWITNYERLDSFDFTKFQAVVLDESSILKSLDGTTRRKLTDSCQSVQFRLCNTATPAPNDQSEIGNHSEFLGVCSMQEMLAMFFVHANHVKEIRVGDKVIHQKQAGKKGQEWRLKYHAKDAFFQWLASWGMFVRKPSNLGYTDDGFNLPELSIKPIFVESDYVPEDKLFFTGLHGVQDRNRVRKSTEPERAAIVADLVNHDSKDQWIIWCGLNTESEMLARMIPDAIEVIGSDSAEEKSNAFDQFVSGEKRILLTKAKIAGFGMNFQNAHKMCFFGLSDSWESYYQCIRREWRFGQKSAVEVHIVISELEREIYDNVIRKEKMANEMATELISRIINYEREELNMESTPIDLGYKEETVKTENFTAMLGDSSKRLAEIGDNSIDLSMYSPPFADLYTYSNSERDLGNSKNWSEFFQHYAFIIQELLRVTKPGRLTCVHSADIPAMAVKDGYIGMKDFPGAVIAAYEKEGWIFSGRAIVGKNPQAQAIRTKAKALLFAQLKKDSSDSRPAILDQILIFTKPGENLVPVMPVENHEITNEIWIDWAGGIWTGIQESDTLQYTTARAADDEKHICPLQLGTIERCIKLYSNPGETVLTPFLGIGSEAYVALKFRRKAIGIELKESYFHVAVKNLKQIEATTKVPDLFALNGIEVNPHQEVSQR
jgi:DNA modification methylase/superfamily II DNA or RNA helicase